MRTRWMKSVIETSKQAATPMPFQRGKRRSTRHDAILKTVSVA